MLASLPENIRISNHSRQLNFIIAIIILCHDLCLFLESPNVMTTRMHSSRMCTAHSSSRYGGPGPDPPQLPPWVRAWTRSLSTAPLGVGLDQIPLNFPLGCGPGPDPPQLPPWVWAWRAPSQSLETCKACWNTTTPRDQTPQTRPPPEQAPPPVNRILDTRF